jgi:NAD(P)-dependent dehydrogenase (short-subunit alcohol dehydrogenase family)
MWNLQSKKALVTGGTKGIGLAIVKEFLSLGAEVLVVARDTKNIQGKVKHSANLFTMEGDVTHPAFRIALLEKVKVNWGKLDLLVNNVGTNVRKKFVDYTEEEYKQLFETNLFSLTETLHNISSIEQYIGVYCIYLPQVFRDKWSLFFQYVPHARHFVFSLSQNVGWHR